MEVHRKGNWAGDPMRWLNGSCLMLILIRVSEVGKLTRSVVLMQLSVKGTDLCTMSRVDLEGFTPSLSRYRVANSPDTCFVLTRKSAGSSGAFKGTLKTFCRFIEAMMKVYL